MDRLVYEQRIKGDITIMLTLFIILTVLAIIVAGSHYLYFLLWKGDFENSKTQYSKAISFCKMLNKKMKYFPDKNVTWLKIYMNFVLPILCILSIYGLATHLKENLQDTNNLIPQLILVLSLIINAIFIRFIDKSTFISTIVANAILLVYLLLASGNVGVAIIFFIVYGLPIGANILYFAKRKELFWKSLKELKTEYHTIFEDEDKLCRKRKM